MRQSMPFGRHCERSAAIHAGMKSWIATAFGLAMTRWGAWPRDDEGAWPRDNDLVVTARSDATWQSMPFGWACKRHVPDGQIFRWIR